MKQDENKKEKSYRKEEASFERTHRGLPQMCPKYLTKNNMW